MRIGKKSGGCSIAYRGKTYAWKNDGAVIQVPGELAADLLRIAPADYFEPAEAPAPAPVTEPAPAPRAAVTEPAPVARAPVAGGPAKPQA